VQAKPRQIEWFVGLQCLGFALSAPKIALNWKHLTAQGSVGSLVVTLFLTIAIIVFLIWKITQRKNWARITLLVFFLMGLVPFAFNVRSELSRSVSLAAVSIVQAALQASSLAVVFTNPANMWFRSVRPDRQGPNYLTNA